MAYKVQSILDMQGLPIINSPIFNVGTTGSDVEKQAEIDAFKSNVNNQIKGLQFYDALNNELNIWNGTEWETAIKGALTFKGSIDSTLDNSGSEDTADHKRNLPTTNVNIGDEWVVATTGEYVFNGNTITMNAHDILICNSNDPTITWTRIESGEGFLTSTFAYNSEAPTTKSWTIANTLKNININVDVYKNITIEEDGSTVNAHEKILCDITITTNNIYISFDRALTTGESYTVIASSN